MSRCLCIAEGYDFGNLVGCPELSILEKTLVSQYIFDGTLIKLVAWKGIRQNALKGHIIAFGHTAVNAINRTATLLFPWLEETEILMSLKVSFVGPRNVADKTFKALCLDSGLLRADMRPLLWWLKLLQACHPGYKHLRLPSKAQQDRTQVRLRELQSKIIAGAQKVHTRLSRYIEKRAGADIAAVRCLPEDHDMEDDGNSSGSDLSDSSLSGDESPEIDVDDPEFQQKLNFILADTMIVDDSTVSYEPNSNDILTALLCMMKRNPDSTGPSTIPLTTARSEEPVNEFGNTDVLFYFALPTLFPFGRGLPEGSSALPSRIVRHCFLQYHSRHARDQRFCYSHFNITQRHTVSRISALRVRNAKPIIAQFMSLIREDNFLVRLSLAVQAPGSEDAKMIAQQVLPLVSNMGKSIPFSPSERRDMFSSFVSSMYRFGTGFLFVSAALDDKNHVFAVRLSIPSTSNTRFPATDSGFQHQMFEKKDMFTEDGILEENQPFLLKIDNKSLIKLMSESPVAAVQFYKTLFEVHF
jgi:hypothetical protein